MIEIRLGERIVCRGDGQVFTGIPCLALVFLGSPLSPGLGADKTRREVMALYEHARKRVRIFRPNRSKVNGYDYRRFGRKWRKNHQAGILGHQIACLPG